MTTLAIVALVLSLIPAAMFLRNLPRFRIQKSIAVSDTQAVSVLIPARDEAEAIAACVDAALASQGVAVEVIVLDDHSTDATAVVVQEMVRNDSRVRYVAGQELPGDWNGKQFACKQLADAATQSNLVFLDADVRLRPEALCTLVYEKRKRDVALISQFPHQVTLTVAEKTLIPLMHYILLGYLPFARMRASSHPAYAAGCGQCFLTTKTEYEAAGTHQAIRGSRHDGLKLPKAYRQAGLATDVIDGTDLADCRMYCTAGEVINGVLKNAHEGIANPARIVPFTILLLGGSVLPVVVFAASIATQNLWTGVISFVAIIAGHLPRLLAAGYFRQSWLGAILHSPGTLVFVLLQWIALVNHLRGKQVAWRGRV